MDLDPKDRAALLDLMAEKILADFRARVGDLTELVAIPLASAAAQLSLSTKTAGRRLPVTKAADGKDCVTLANLARYVALRTAYPKGWPADLRFSPEASPDQRPPAPDPNGTEHSQHAGGRHPLRAVV